jgi:hypothetical protein
MNTQDKNIDNIGNDTIHSVRHSLSQLKEGDYIAFPFTYNGEQVEIIVDNITSVNDKEVLVHFLYGHHSLAEYIKKEDIIAIGDMNANGKIKGWSGKFNILKPNHDLL